MVINCLEKRIHRYVFQINISGNKIACKGDAYLTAGGRNYFRIRISSTLELELIGLILNKVWLGLY